MGCKKIIFPLLLTALLLLAASPLMAEQICSRVAVVNYQEVLVDHGSSQKGEGLRYLLEKDAEAEKYLKFYQEGSKTKWGSAVAGTIGSALLFAGVLTSKEQNNRNALIAVGAGIIGINFIVSKTMEINNETNLNRAIDEYNRRNLPRIHFDITSDSGLIFNVTKDY